MPEHPHGRWFPRQTLAISPHALQAMLEARGREDDQRMADALQAARERLAHRESLVARMRCLTDVYALSRMILSEARETLGYEAGLVALVGDESFLEVTASSSALVPEYRTEVLEEAFIAGEAMHVAAENDHGLASIGNAEIPPGTKLRAVPFDGLDDQPLGVLLLEGAPHPTHEAWVAGFVELAARALAECRQYVQFESLLFDAAIAVASRNSQGAVPPARLGGRLRTLCCGIAASLGLPESDVRRAGFLATLHLLGPEAMAEGLRHLRHGRQTGRAWQEAQQAPATWQIFPSPFEAWDGLFAALAGGGGVDGCDMARLASILRVALAFQRAVARRPRQDRGRVAAALTELVTDEAAGLAPDVVAALARHLGSRKG